MKIVFFGTPEFVIPILDSLNKAFKIPNEGSPIQAVITQGPKPIGRDKALSYSPVDDWAHKREIPKYFDPNDILKYDIDADLGILAAYGEMIPDKVIKHFPMGIINIHPSQLPKYRGASPIQAALASGDTTTCVSFMKMDDKMDHGPVVSYFKENIDPDEDQKALTSRLFERSAEALPELIRAYIANKPTIKSQDHAQATYTRLISKDDGFIDWIYLEKAFQGKTSTDKREIHFVKDLKINYSPLMIYNLYRALTPWPGLWTIIATRGEEKRVKIIKCHLENVEVGSPKLVLDIVQMEGKNESDWETFRSAYLN